MERQGRWDEALADVPEGDRPPGDAAPESNLDAGLIYLNHIKDPIYAIYYFRKYLELEPNSKQAGYVRGLIEAAKREFARALPGQPLESETEHLGVEEQVDAPPARERRAQGGERGPAGGRVRARDALELDRHQRDPLAAEPGRGAGSPPSRARPSRSPRCDPGDAGSLRRGGRTA